MLEALYAYIVPLISLPHFFDLYSSSRNISQYLTKSFSCVPTLPWEHTQLWGRFQTLSTLLGFFSKKHNLLGSEGRGGSSSFPQVMLGSEGVPGTSLNAGRCGSSCSQPRGPAAACEGEGAVRKGQCSPYVSWIK